MAGNGLLIDLATLQKTYMMAENDRARYAEESQNACPLTPSTDYAWSISLMRQIVSCDQYMVQICIGCSLYHFHGWTDGLIP